MVMFTALPTCALRPGNRNALVRNIDVVQNRTIGGYHDAEVTVVLIESAYADFQVLVEFFAVVGLAQNGNVPVIERNAVGTIVLHGADQLAVAERMVADEFDGADFNFGTFINLEDEDYGVARGDAFVLRGDFGELAAVLAEQFLQNDFRLS